MDNLQEILFDIKTINGDVLASNLPSGFIIPECEPSAIKLSTCLNYDLPIRQGIFISHEIIIYIASYKKNITNKILKKYYEACLFFIPKLIEAEKSIRQKESQNFRRLRHNLVTHNTNILQELEKTFPLDQAPKGGSQQNVFVKEILTKNSNDAALSILKVIKSANLMKSDFDVYDILHSKKPLTEFDFHSIHRVTTLVLKPFWLDFFEKGVDIEISECHEKVFIDYKTISVVFSHLFDNAIKYIAPKSRLKISFISEATDLAISFEMISLKMTNQDVEKIYEENYSGEYATMLNKAGDGIGMNVVQKLVFLNNGNILIENNIDSKSRVTIMGIPFEKNRITISLKKTKQT